MAASRAAAKFGAHLKELRLHLCQKSSESAGVREFVTKHYPSLKASNPTLPVLNSGMQRCSAKAVCKICIWKRSHVLWQA
uniref:Putative nadhubiquinone oxidoreductase ndufa2/b8 subunit n=1 Tax=Ixodes ricinus TaxID=34613 RepID=V5GXF5_IXORI